MYTSIEAQKYELPCRPEEVHGLSGKISEQRIDPELIAPVHNPFGEEIKPPQSSRHVKSKYSRNLSMRNGHHSKTNSFAAMLGQYKNHDRNESMTASSFSSPFGQRQRPSSARHNVSDQPRRSFLNDVNKLKLFRRAHKSADDTEDTNMNIMGALPPLFTTSSPEMDSDRSDEEDVDEDSRTKSTTFSAEMLKGRSKSDRGAEILKNHLSINTNFDTIAPPQSLTRPSSAPTPTSPDAKFTIPPPKKPPRFGYVQYAVVLIFLILFIRI